MILQLTNSTFSDPRARVLLAVSIGLLAIAGCDTRPQGQPAPARESAPRVQAAPSVQAVPTVARAATPKTAQATTPKSTHTTGAFARDIRAICFAQEDSGALEANDYERQLIVAQWLGKEVKSEPGRAFLAQLARASAADKGELLKAASVQAGLATCPLISTWSGTGAAPAKE